MNREKFFEDEPMITDILRIPLWTITGKIVIDEPTVTEEKKYLRVDHHYTKIFSNELFMTEIRNIQNSHRNSQKSLH